jgi:hypothetical protein
MGLSSSPAVTDDRDLPTGRALSRQPLGVIVTGLAFIAGT